VTFLGLVAGALTAGCWFPQLMRSWRTRSTGDLSWVYIAALGAGILLWLLYGVILGDIAIIATNGVTLLALLTLAGIKARFDARPA
jgi:MtN3 and saliva related transmembrane protein